MHLRPLGLFALIFFLSSVCWAVENPPYTFSDLVRKERAAVVNIRSSVLLGKPGPIREFYGDLHVRSDQEPLGTGFVISADGFVLTNAHVVAAAEREGGEGEPLRIQLPQQRQVKARVVGRDAQTDLALLKIIEGGQGLPHVTLGDSDHLEVGEWVLAIGDPFGGEETVSVGIVSATGRSIGSGPYDNFIQTDASIYAGNSGGPLFDIQGNVIGINTALPSAGQGIGFAIPINMAKTVVGQLRQRGRVVRAWLGVMIQEVTPELAKAFGLHRAEGALVSDVMERSPAKEAGILRGDIIVSFDGKRVDQMQKMPLMVAETPLGRAVEVVLIRDGRERQLQVQVAQLPEEPKGRKPGAKR